MVIVLLWVYNLEDTVVLVVVAAVAVEIMPQDVVEEMVVLMDLMDIVSVIPDHK